jgi:3-methyladenine DNA glycosylase AlkD
MDLVRAARTGLARIATPAKAEDMRRYMKSALPFRGVAKPERARLARTLFADHPMPDRETWIATVLELWREAEFREERYLALDLTGAYRQWQDADLVPLYDELVVTGAWWDFVDEIASRRIGPLLRADHPTIAPLMREWSTDTDRWRRRTSVICQLGSKSATDTDLLTDCVEANLTDPDFFLRKGIGWALRDFAKTEPGWVLAFVADHPTLSPLSKREALKHLG